MIGDKVMVVTNIDVLVGEIIEERSKYYYISLDDGNKILVDKCYVKPYDCCKAFLIELQKLFNKYDARIYDIDLY